LRGGIKPQEGNLVKEFFGVAWQEKGVEFVCENP
jgi:hypothetical protein